MANCVQVKKVSIKHEQILQFLIANPTLRMYEVAAHFEVSASWLSVIIHSDAFQHLLEQYQAIVFDETILPMRKRLEALAHLSLERLSDQVERSYDMKELRETAKMTLQSLGYGTPAAGPTQINAPGATITINPGMQDKLQEARRLIGSVQPQISPHRLSDSSNAGPIEDATFEPDDSQGEGSLGGDPAEPALLSSEASI